MTVQGTWQGGQKVDLVAFLSEVEAIDPTEHAQLAAQAASRVVSTSACRCTSGIAWPMITPRPAPFGQGHAP